MRFFREMGELKGLKRFSFEVLIIVIGVGITLMAQEAITDASQAREARRAVDAVEVDLVAALNHTSERLAIEPCRREQVRALADKLQKFDATWTAQVPESINKGDGDFVMPRVLRTPGRPWGNDSWKALLASDSAIHVERSQFTALSIIFQQVERVRAAQDDALRLNGSLSHLAFSGPLDASQRRQALSQLGELSNIDGLIHVHQVNPYTLQIVVGKLFNHVEIGRQVAKVISKTLLHCRLQFTNAVEDEQPQPKGPSIDTNQDGLISIRDL